jgi:quaternary ammonium compound-resistance protein SugE
LGTVAARALSIYLLSTSIKSLPVGTACAVRTGIGAAGAAVPGILLPKVSTDLFGMLYILLVVVGVVGLGISSSG